MKRACNIGDTTLEACKSPALKTCHQTSDHQNRSQTHCHCIHHGPSFPAPCFRDWTLKARWALALLAPPYSVQGKYAAKLSAQYLCQCLAFGV